MSEELELQNLLISVTKPDTNLLKSSTQKLQQFMTQHPKAAELMLQQVSKAPAVEARQMAAILLRREIGKMWNKMDPKLRKQCQVLLLERLVAEESNVVRLPLAVLIKDVAKLCEEWPALFKVLEQIISNNVSENLRETGIKLMKFLVSTKIGMEHWETFIDIFQKTIVHQGSSLRLRVEAVKGWGTCSNYLDIDEPGEAKKISPIIGPILQVLKETIDANEEMMTGNVIEVLNTFLDMNFNVVGNEIAEVSKTMLQIAKMKDIISRETRAMAVKHLELLCRRRMKMVQRMKMVLPIFQSCVEMLMEEDPEPDDEAIENDLHGSVSEVLDTIFCQVPKQTYQSALNAVNKLTSETDTQKHFAGVLLLMLMTEGCSDLIKADEDLLKKLCEFAIKELKNEAPRVRAMACQVVVQFANFLEPEVLRYSAPILEGLVSLLKGTFAKPNTPKIIKCVWDSIENWISELKEGAKSVLPGLMTVLNNTLKEETTDDVKTSVLQVLGTLAAAVRKEFMPYYEPCMKALSLYVTPQVLENRQNDDSFIELVGAAWISIGQMVLAVGIEGNQDISHIIAITKNLVKLMGVEHAPRSSAFAYFGCLAILFKKDLMHQSFCAELLQMLYKTLEGDDGFELLEDEEQGPSAAQFGFETENKGNFDIEDVTPNCKMQINTLVVEERAQALHMSKLFLEHVPFPLKTMKEIYVRVVLTFDYPHPSLRVAVTEVLNEVLVAAVKQHPVAPWKRGVLNEIHQDLDNFIVEICTLWISSLEEDDDCDNVALVLEYLGTQIEKIGPAFLMAKIEEKTLYEYILESCEAALDEKLLCQEKDEAEESGEAIEDIHKSVIDSVFGLFCAISRAMGAQFAPKFMQLFPKYVKFCNSNKHVNTRSMGIGCLGDVFKYMSGDDKTIIPYLGRVFYEAHKMVSFTGETNKLLRQNSIYTMGIIFQVGGTNMVQQHETFIKDCLPLMNLPQEGRDGFVRDNAISAMCKMVTGCGSQLNADVLKNCAERILAALPLTHDKVENEFVYTSLVDFWKFKEKLGLSQEAVQVLQNQLRAGLSLDDESLPADNKKKLQQFCAEQNIM